MLAVYLRGMLISIALVSSIGMQNLFVFNSAMSNRLRRALLIAAFVWVADTTLTVVAFLGVGTIITHYQWLKLVILLVGGVVVIWMGWGILRSANATTLGGGDTAMPLKEAFTGAWVVAFANPQAIIDTSVSFGAMRSTLSNSQVLPFLLGILSSTALWFFGVTLIIGILKNRLPRRFLLWINIISGAIVMVYGVTLVGHAVLMVV
ncbi:LysE/ArgO family amino acid transporter [Lacticaseibacillus thailandensis]|uniref:Amino acid export protein n=1 Tax=Lacticaseibacillus thailandensis DSM 22698 = JCM 13996 TaxID=1423810 RepID=A0A0R2C783_9LACO|nr:LysE family transporter [Lacticaseibacillus thailandensis]KRM87242.1 amino acid export protein [Lacticaseibacillus thailandensis DSM 22698 = JCM 13996]